MAVLYDVEHVTTYRYANPVTFGPHRAMFLPRSGPYGRILSSSATTNLASRVRWIIDALSNVVTVIEIDQPGTELSFTFRLRGIHYGVAEAEAFPLEARAEAVPVQYTPDEWNDLSRYLRGRRYQLSLRLAMIGRPASAYSCCQPRRRARLSDRSLARAQASLSQPARRLLA